MWAYLRRRIVIELRSNAVDRDLQAERRALEYNAAPRVIYTQITCGRLDADAACRTGPGSRWGRCVARPASASGLSQRSLLGLLDPCPTPLAESSSFMTVGARRLATAGCRGACSTPQIGSCCQGAAQDRAVSLTCDDARRSWSELRQNFLCRKSSCDTQRRDLPRSASACRGTRADERGFAEIEVCPSSTASRRAPRLRSAL